MRKIVTLSLAAAALIGAGGVAYAQVAQAPGDAPAPVTRAEVEQRSAAMFARMDANSDGKLDQADRDTHRQERRAEGETRRKAAFDRLDADKNGAISFEEFAAMRDQRGEHRGPGRRGRDMARNADTNRDGTVTQAEFASAALARFDRIDVDKDGTISADERPARHPMRRERRFRDAG